MKSLRTSVLWIFAAANAALIVWFWSQTSGGMLSLAWSAGSPAVSLGRICGLLLQFALLIQLVIIGRVTWIEQSFGHDGLNRLHRILGYTLIVLLVAHPLLLSIGYGLMQSRGIMPAFVGLVSGWEDVLNAVLGALLFVAVIALSVPWVRRRLKYEYWHAAHLLTYIAIALAFGHQIEDGGDFRSGALTTYWYVLNFGVFGVYFLYRFLRPILMYAKHRFVVERVERVSPDAWSITISGRAMASFSFRAGQFATLQFAARGLWTPHPFSFSREYDGRTIRFTVKELGDATRSIERLRPGTPVLIDGPLGVFTPALATTEKYLLIAGGIGVTPLRAMAGDLMKRGADVVVLYAIRNMHHASLAEELRELGVPMKLVVSESGAAIPKDGVSGTIDAAMINRFVPDVANRDVFMCGPSAMMDAVSSAVRSLHVPASRIHTERFGYGNTRMSGALLTTLMAIAFIVAGFALGWFVFVYVPDTRTSDITVTPLVSPDATVLPTSLPSSLPSSSPKPTIAVTPTPQAAGTYTLAQIAQHNNASSCWTAINGMVYDVTTYFNSHPGGPGTIEMLCGIDGSTLYNGQHGGQPRPANELVGFKIGVLAK